MAIPVAPALLARWSDANDVVIDIAKLACHAFLKTERGVALQVSFVARFHMTIAQACCTLVSQMHMHTH